MGPRLEPPVDRQLHRSRQIVDPLIPTSGRHASPPGCRSVVAKPAARSVAHVRDSIGMRQLIKAHRTTVVTDPHVPGPGFSRPMPQKVATRFAQCGRRGRDTPATAGGTPALRSGAEVSLRVSFTRFRPGRGCCPGLPLRPAPVQKSRTPRSPIFRDRSGDSDRYKRGSRGQYSQLTFYRSDSEVSIGEA